MPDNLSEAEINEIHATELAGYGLVVRKPMLIPPKVVKRKRKKQKELESAVTLYQPTDDTLWDIIFDSAESYRFELDNSSFGEVGLSARAIVLALCILSTNNFVGPRPYIYRVSDGGVVLDWELPTVNGVFNASEIRCAPNGKDIHVLIDAGELSREGSTRNLTHPLILAALAFTRGVSPLPAEPAK